MVALGIISGVGIVYCFLFLYALMGPAERFSAAISNVTINYGVRRFLFYDSGLGQSELAWYALILLGDTFVILMIILNLTDAFRPFLWTCADWFIAFLIVVTICLACMDPRVPLLIRLAHWKEEYACLLFYVLSRQCGREVGMSVGPLLGLSVLAAVWSMRQIIWGPTALDIAWIESGRSVLAQSGTHEVVGAHGLGNLEAGWLRPYAFFGNGTDMGVFMAFVWALVRARHCVEMSWMRRILLLSLCACGSFLTMVRFTWVVFCGTVIGQFFTRLSSSLWRWGIILCVTLGLGTTAIGVLSVAPQGGPIGSLFDRVLFMGTYTQRVYAQVAWFQRLAQDPGVLFIGKGFGAGGAAHAKFSEPVELDENAPPYHHSRALDFIEDGGILLLILVALALGTGLRNIRHTDILSCTMASFVAFLVVASVFLGGKSVLLGSLLWSALGVVVSRRELA